MGIDKADPVRKYEIGREYSERKITHYNKFTVPRKGEISVEMASEYGIGSATVKRWYAFFRAVNAIRKASPEAADKLMDGTAHLGDRAIAKMLKDRSVDAAVESILGRKPDPEGNRDAARIDMICRIKADMRDHTRNAYTVDMLVGDIRADADNFLHNLRGTLEERSGMLTDGTKPQVAAEIARIADEILKVREAL